MIFNFSMPAAPPRIVLDPPNLDGVYKVELGRPLNVQCRVDPRYFPNVDISTFQVQGMV